MPLVHSKSNKAFKSNLKAELNAGKPQKQALAIAYSVQRRSHKAHGGPVISPKKPKHLDKMMGASHSGPSNPELAISHEVDHGPKASSDHNDLSLIEHVLQRRKMASGGQVEDVFAPVDDFTDHTDVPDDEHDAGDNLQEEPMDIIGQALKRRRSR